MKRREHYRASDLAIELGYSPLPWSVTDFARKSSSEFSAINIDCHVPRRGGMGMTVAELFYYKSWQDAKVPRSVVEANAKLIVDAVNQHATLTEQRDKLATALRELVSVFPERPVDDGSGGVAWNATVTQAYDNAINALATVEQGERRESRE